MKLNLLPKTVSKNVQSKTMLMVMTILVLVSLVGAFMYNRKLNGDLQSYKDESAQLEANAEKVRQTQKHAEEIIADAAIVLTNSSLVNKIDEANKAYPDLYDEVRKHIPSFYRLRSMEAASHGAESCTVTLTGYLKTFQQYSDIMLSLLRMPGLVSIARAGYNPVAPGNEGPFAYNPDNPERGPIPGESEVIITMVVAKDLTAPDARETLQAAAAGGGTGGTGGGPGGRNPAGGAGGRTGGPTTPKGGGGGNG